jgi:hypothetical protein
MIPVDDILDIPKYRGREDLAKILRGSSYDLNVSNNYGSHLYSLLTTAEIYSPIDKYELLSKLPPEDEEEIIKALHVHYPVKDREPEIVSLAFFVDPHSPIPNIHRGVGKLRDIDFDYIREQINKCDDKINAGDYDGAITNARSLVESVCKYILDEKRTEYSEDEKLPSLYKKVSRALNMDPSEYDEKPFKEALSGCISIISGISNIRNILSDAHGRSRKSKYKASGRHAVLATSMSKAISDYLFSSFKEKSTI